jgi:hypothetical protein
VVAKRCWDGWFGQSEVIGGRRAFVVRRWWDLGQCFSCVVTGWCQCSLTLLP